jgi:hypothetical protein
VAILALALFAVCFETRSTSEFCLHLFLQISKYKIFSSTSIVLYAFSRSKAFLIRPSRFIALLLLSDKVVSKFAHVPSLYDESSQSF